MMRADFPAAGLVADACRTIRDIDETGWNRCFPGDPENWAYYLALEESELSAFSWAYLVVREGTDVLAVAPAFLTDYRLDTTIQGTARSVLRPVLALLGNALTARLLCLGSPHADTCHFGFAPALSAVRRAEAASLMVEKLKAFAADQGIGLLAAKDIADKDAGHGVHAILTGAGFSRQPGLPNAVLPLPAQEEAYLALLTPAMRREIRRKLKRSDAVQVLVRRGEEGIEYVPQIAALYESQRSGSSVDFDQFETLTPAYFRSVMGRLGDAALLFVYLHGGKVVAFNLCLHTGSLFIDKFIGFLQPQARSLDLYVLSWMTNVRYCIARRIPSLQSGQTGYAMKRRLGSELRASWLYFFHHNPAANLALRLAGPLLAADRHDQDLARDRPVKP